MSTRDYEAMFLLDNQASTADFEATAAQVDKILAKHGAAIVQNEKWDERRLAYEIKGHRRATYYLVYFTAPSAAITEIDNDVALNEVILRHLVIALDEPIDEHIKHRADDREKMAEESRRSSLSGWGDRKGRVRGERDRREPKPESEKDESGKPESGKPESGKPESGKPEGGEKADAPAEEKKTEVAVTSAESGKDDAGAAS